MDIHKCRLGEHKPWVGNTGESTRVSSHEWRTSDHVLTTQGASTCIVLVAHSSVTHEGIMGHFVASEVSDGSDAAMLDEALDAVMRLEPVEQTHVWIGGAALAFGDMNNAELLEVAREVCVGRDAAERVVARRMNEAGVPTVTFDWQHAGSLKAELNCQLGRLTIESSPEG